MTDANDLDLSSEDKGYTPVGYSQAGQIMHYIIIVGSYIWYFSTQKDFTRFL